MVSFYVSFLSLLLLRHGRDFCTADASAEQATMNRLGRCSSSMFSRRRSAIVRVVFKICKSPRVEIPNLVASLNRFLSFFERGYFLTSWLEKLFALRHLVRRPFERFVSPPNSRFVSMTNCWAERLSALKYLRSKRPRWFSCVLESAPPSRYTLFVVS